MVQKERVERGEENVNEMGGAWRPFEIHLDSRGKDVTIHLLAVLQNDI